MHHLLEHSLARKSASGSCSSDGNEVKDILNNPKTTLNAFFERKRKDGIYKFTIGLIADGNDA